MREQSIFIEALERADPAERAAYLDRACAADPALRGRIERLFQRHEQTGDFLDRPPPWAVETGAAPDPTGADQVVGPYKLLEPIGEGGMGTVYMAEQTEPVRRRVALKVIKPGMDSKQIVARFEAERQALAMMDHPNIARVFDAGMTPAGRPYFVMELVRGLPITEYCDREELTISERLELFVLVCRAVQHAHQKGIIHRDLKPSNVLVTVIDGVAVPKVIDFGVAKATGPTLTDKTLFTGFHQFVGTPLYVSPEQADLAGVDVDTRSDIYSLGVLLYELLTGTTPFDSETLKRAAFDEMRRMIREDEPPRPSTRISTLNERLSTVSARRKADPRRLGPSLRGELDWVVMKALEKDRRRRYETANDFAADVMRYLTDQPVAACPPSVWYRSSKFARRNRVGLITVGLVATALVAGTGISVWQAVRATRAGILAAQREKEARDSEAESEAVLKYFIADVFGAAAPEHAQGRDLKVSEALVKAVKRLDTAFADRPLVEASVRGSLASTFRRIGKYDLARPHATRCLDLRRSLLGPEHPKTLGAMNLLAGVLQEQAEYDEARTLYEMALKGRRLALGPEHPDTLDSMNDLAVLLAGQGKYAEARELHEQILEVCRRVFGPEHRHTLRSLHNLADLLLREGKHEAALTLMHQVLEAERRVLGPEKPETIASMINMIAPLCERGRLDEARTLGEQALEAARRVMGTGHPLTLECMYQMARVLHEQGESRESQTLLEQAIEARRRALGPEDLTTLDWMGNLAFVLDAQGKFDEAYELNAQLLESSRRLRGPDHLRTLGVMVNQAMVLLDQGKPDEARKLNEEVLNIQRRVLGPEHRSTLGTMSNLAILLGELGKHDEARKMEDQVFQIRRRVVGAEHRDTLVSMNNLAQYLRSLEDFDGARTLTEQVLEIRRRTLGHRHPETRAALNNLIAILLQTPAAPDHARGLELARQGVELDPDVPLRWMWLGLAEYRNGHWGAAIQAAEKCVAMRSGEGGVVPCIVLAVSHARRGELNQAREWYLKARPAVETGMGLGDTPRWLVEEASRLLGEEPPGDEARPTPAPESTSPPR